MKKEDFLQAIQILSEHHTSEIVINQPINHFIGDLGTTKWTIHIKKCVPAVVDRLVEAGFMLSMGEHGLYIDKI